MEFMILVVVLFALIAARFIRDMKATSSTSDSEASRPRIAIEDEEDEHETYDDSHPPVEQPVPLRSSASTWSSFYD